MKKFLGILLALAMLISSALCVDEDLYVISDKPVDLSTFTSKWTYESAKPFYLSAFVMSAQNLAKCFSLEFDLLSEPIGYIGYVNDDHCVILAPYEPASGYHLMTVLSVNDGMFYKWLGVDFKPEIGDQLMAALCDWYEEVTPSDMQMFLKMQEVVRQEMF